MLLSTIILYLTLAVCSVAIGTIAWRYDAYMREPWYMILATAAAGAALMWLAGQVQIFIIVRFAEHGRIMPNVSIASLAGLTEEIAKLTVVAAIAILAPKQLNEPIDGIIYGSFAGLGAAIEESIWIMGLDHPHYLPPQEPVRLAGHLVFGGIGGFGVGLLVTRAPRAALWTLLCIVGAATIHSLWDVIAFDASATYNASHALHWYHTMGGVVVMLCGMIAYRCLITNGAKRTLAWMNLRDLSMEMPRSD